MTNSDAIDKLINALELLTSAVYHAHGAMYDSKNIGANEYIAGAIEEIHTSGQDLKIAMLLLQHNSENVEGPK